MKEEDSVAANGTTKGEGGEWTSSRRSGRRARPANRHQNDSSAVNDELRVDTRSKVEIERAKELQKAPSRQNKREEASSNDSEHSDQLEEAVIPVTVLTSMEAETKTGRGESCVHSEHVPGKDEGDETEDEIALLEYLSGAESDYYELDRASRKGEDGEDQTPVMSLSPRSFDESLGTPESPGGLLSVDEHGGFAEPPIRYTTVTRRMMVHAQEAPRQVSTHVVESAPGSLTVERGGAEEGGAEAKQAVMRITQRQVARPRQAAVEDENEWIACETEDGLTYYYNQSTHESQWTLPTACGVRSYTTEELFAAVSSADLSESDSRQLSIMLHSGMDLHAVNSDGLTPLHVACKVGNEQTAALLIYYGAKLDARAVRDDSTPLILACRSESEGIVKLLVEADASLSANDCYGNTALHVAVQTGNECVVKFVLGGCDHTVLSTKNNEGETALHIAAKLGYFGVVRSLLAYGASAKDEDSQGRTPLILSILENHVECVQLLQSVESNASPAKPTAAPYYSSGFTSDRRQGSGVERDALTVLHSYLFQILSDHSATESQTVYQLVEEVRGQIGALNASLQASNGREAHYRARLEEMSSNLAGRTEELKNEQDRCANLRNQLAVRELELEASRVSHRALSSRCELLESIARSAQEKLGRERSEHLRYEESMQEKLHRSLQENASVIESCSQLQAGWSDQQHQRQYDPRLGRRDSHGFYEISEDLAQVESVQESNGENYHLLETEGSASVTSGNQFRERAPSDQQQQRDEYRHSIEQYQYDSAPELLDTPPPLLDDSDESPTNKDNETPTLSPTRVGAVWNRFFENVGHASDPHERNDPKSYETSYYAASQPQLTYPSSSLVFDAVRKNELRKLQDVLLRGVSPNQRDVAEKGTPLHLACELGDTDAVMLLSEFAADLEARDEARNTPLLAACFQGNFECVKFLLQSAVSLRAVNDNGDTALHLSAWDGSISCVMILLEYGIDPVTNNHFGLTALGNMKTRSPLRHKFDDLPEDHPMRRTLLVLEEAERQRLQEIDDQSTDVEDTTEPPQQEKSGNASKRPSWAQWLLGFRGEAEQTGGNPEQKSEAGDAHTSTTATEDNEADSEDAEDWSTYEESRLMMSETQHEPLTPPPEIEEALRRAKAGGHRSEFESSNAAPMFPVARQDLAKHMSFRNPTKPHPPAAPTTIRARYVDTFNTP